MSRTIRFKLFSLICAFCIFFSISSCLADELYFTENNTSILRMTNINDARCSLSVNNGKASAIVEVTGKLGSERCEISLNIQVQDGEHWITVHSWTTEKNGRNATLNQSIDTQTGKIYRAEAIITVWLDGVSESQTITTTGKTA